jgi:hypothetical protein
MAEARDEERAREVCAYKLQALQDELQPAVASCRSAVAELTSRINALASQLYNRHHPVSDITMIALCAAAAFLTVEFVVTFGASAAGNTFTLLKFGWDTTTCVVVGTIGTALVTAVGRQFHAKLIAKHPRLDMIVVLVISALTLWALVDFGRARGVMTQMSSQSSHPDTYVDDSATSNATEPPEKTLSSNESDVRDLFSDASTKLTIVADLAVGLLLGALVALWTGEDFAGWRRLRREKRQMTQTQHQLNELVAVLEMAKKRCAAGIVRARHFQNPNHPPYLAALVILALMGSTQLLVAQGAESVTREEVICLDVSRSTKADAFAEILQGAKQLLKTEPAESRTWTLLISTDSFDGVRTLLRGWTPAAQGVFTDRLDQARAQLVSSFQTKSAGLKPTAGGTDIFGAVARAKALFEEDPNNTHYLKELHLFTDGVNETPAFNMPALLPTGVENMLSLARANRLVVPLPGVRVYMWAAAAPNAEAYAATKAFWSAYLKAAGAELVVYSTEASVFRR